MIRIGIICPSEIALRRFLPALDQCDEFRYIGVAVANSEEWFGAEHSKVSEDTKKRVRESELLKAQKFKEEQGGDIFESYEEMLSSSEIDAVYLPLPPALHFKWAQKALENNKHVFVEKPSTTSAEDTHMLIEKAEKNNLAVHENYMFVFHDQLKEIEKVVARGEIGDIRVWRIDFGFPRRSKNDFRYSKKLGGGALLDCGGYTLKYANMLLGGKGKIEYAKLNYTDEFEVDLYGTAAMSNEKGQVVQISFGMDNFYKCDLEAWGSTGRIVSGRILTAPAGFVPKYTIFDKNGSTEKELPVDDTFLKSLQYFAKCIEDKNVRKDAFKNICIQAELVDEFLKKSMQNGKH